MFDSRYKGLHGIAVSPVSFIQTSRFANNRYKELLKMTLRAYSVVAITKKLCF
jgi:hypothetical protein